MVQSDYFSSVTLPHTVHTDLTVLEFLRRRFPFVSSDNWKRRIAEEKVLDWDNRPVTAETRVVPGRKIYYVREVEIEPVIPFAENILFGNDEILVVCKPHFLPVVPAGSYVNECLLARLKRKTGNADLVPLHRIDRQTAGIVLFSVNPETRGLYHDLFRLGKMEKTYQAVAKCAVPPAETSWTVINRLLPGEPWFRMKVVAGAANSRSRIELLKRRGDKGFFQLHPETGKKHQLRVHMSGLGFTIMHDRWYPELLPPAGDDFNRPLQLLAQRIRFCDPVSGKNMEFCSERHLVWH